MLVRSHISSWTIKEYSRILEYSNFLHFQDVFDQIYFVQRITVINGWKIYRSHHAATLTNRSVSVVWASGCLIYIAAIVGLLS